MRDDTDLLLQTLLQGREEEEKEELGFSGQAMAQAPIAAPKAPSEEVDSLMSTLASGRESGLTEEGAAREARQREMAAVERAEGIGQSPIFGGFQQQEREERQYDEVLGPVGSFSTGLMAGAANLPLRAMGLDQGPAYEELSESGKNFYKAGKTLSDIAPFMLPASWALRGTAAAQTAVRSPQLSSAIQQASAAGQRVGATGTPMVPAASQTFMRSATEPLVRSFSVFPKASGIGEISALLGTGQMAYLAQQYFPEDRNVAVFAETAGAFLNPLGAAYRVTNNTVGDLWLSLARRGDTFAKKEAAGLMQELVKDSGEDPVTIAQQYRDLQDVKIAGGVAVKSNALNGLVNSLSKNSPSLRQATREAVETANKRINNQIDLLFSSGDPELVRKAAELRKNHFQTQISAKLEDAVYNASLTVGRMSDGATRAESQLLAEQSSAAGQKQIKRVNDWAVKVQDELHTAAFDRLDEIGFVPEENFSDAFRNTLNSLSQLENRAQVGETLNDVAKAMYGTRIANSIDNFLGGEKVNYRGLYNIAIDAGQKAATQRNAGNYNEANALEGLRLAIIDDVESIDDVSMVNAREFTKAYKDVFERTFAGNAIKGKMPPGQLMFNAMTGGQLKPLEKFRALENAANFDNPNAEPFSPRPETGLAYRNQQELFMLSYASQFIKDGRVNQTALDNFVNRNAALIEEVSQSPGGNNVKSILSDALATEGALKRQISENEFANKKIIEMNVFGNLLDRNQYKTTGDAVESIFSTNPEQGARRLDRMLREFSESKSELEMAKRGLVTSIWDSAIAKASNEVTGDINWRRVGNFLTDEVIEALQKNTIITQSQSEKMKKYRDVGLEMQKAINNPAEVEDVLPSSDFLSQMVIRGAGSVAATNLAKNLGVLGMGQAGPSLVIAQGGSRAAQQILGLNPRGKVVSFLSEATTNNKLAIELLEMENVKSPQKHREALKSIGSILAGVGIADQFNQAEERYIFEQEEERLRLQEEARSQP